METFVAVVVLISGPKHQIRFFGEFSSYSTCTKFTSWQNQSAGGQGLESLTRCLTKTELRTSYPLAFIEEPST